MPNYQQHAEDIATQYRHVVETIHVMQQQLERLRVQQYQLEGAQALLEQLQTEATETETLGPA